MEKNHKYIIEEKENIIKSITRISRDLYLLTYEYPYAKKEQYKQWTRVLRDVEPEQ